MPLNINTDDSSPMSTSDVESFTGKIVCNIDGSSYIIDAENATLSSLNDNSLSVAAISVTNEKTSASIFQATQLSTKSCVNFKVSASKATSISSAITTKTASLAAGATEKKNFTSISCKEGLAPEEEEEEQKQLQKAINPRIHTFRVVSANDADIQLRQENNLFKIQKPILMCFICKLSFGITKSFSLHANTEHGLDLQDLEKHLLMQREYSSAIIQRNMDEHPQISFLEPVDVEATPRIAATMTEEVSGMEAQLGDATTNTTHQKPAASSTSVTVASSVSNASLLSLTSTTSSTSSSSSLYTSSSLSPCFTTNNNNSNNNNNTITTTSISMATNVLAQAVASPDDCDRQSQCMYDNKTPSASLSSGVANLTTSGSLNLDKLETNNYYISETDADNLSSSSTFTTTTVTTATSTFSSLPGATTTLTIATSSSSPSPTPHKPPVPATAPSPISQAAGVDLSTFSGNLATDAISTDSLLNINSNNDTSEPQSQDISTNSSNLSPKSLHITHQQQPSNLNSIIMSDFLQQHLQRLSADRETAEEDCQQENLENYNMSWSLPTASTPFSLPATVPNASVAQISSLHASLAALNSEQSTSSVKLISKFLHHQLAAAQQHQKELTSHSLTQAETCLYPATSSTPNTMPLVNICPEHPDYKGMDCKSCEMLEVHQTYKPSPQVTPQRSPTNSGLAAAAAAAAAAGLGLLTAANPLSISPSHSLNANNLPPGLNVSLNTPPHSNPGSSACFTIGACSEHINGRPLGVECPRCEMILNSARLNSNVQISTRNSCKTLKCPQCNWHYKYQETLEIHMREKHPDGESACGYCLAGQQHPRLARGESYSCGYKPYRCEICNYSTTTKGNLSIHMQSDKHLNNMQELNSSQSMVAAAVAAASGGVGKLDSTPKINLGTTMSSLASQQQQQHQQQHQQQQQQQQQQAHTNVGSSGSMGGNLPTSICGTALTSLQTCNSSSGGASGSSSKPKPSFRCDICSYETSVARNLRIHMTSEKHTHNMAVLQNNIKHIQTLTFIQQQQQQQQQQTQQQENSFIPEVALADLAYNQALMMQLLHQNAAAAAATQTQTPGSSPALMCANKTVIKLQASSPPTTSDLPTSPYSPKSSDFGSSDLTTGNMEPPIKPDLWPTTLFSCLICSNFDTNSLDELNQHLIIDRSRQTTSSTSSTRSMSPTASNMSINTNNSSSGSAYFSDIMIFQNNNYICSLCNYKTNLKANYQLHSKTDKHLQKLNFINHLREGGAANEYKLKYYQQQQQIGANTVQIKCNSCDFYTNSIQKLSLHTQHMRHENMIMIFQHLNYLVQQQQQQQQTSSRFGTDDSFKTINSETAPLSLPDSSTPISTASASSLTLSSQSATAKPAISSVSCNKSLLCHLCNFKANSLLEMIQHVKGIRHLQVEQFVCLQRRSEQLETPSLDDVFKLCNKSQRNNDLATPTSTPTHTSNMIDNKTSSTCFTNLIESVNEDLLNKMFFERNEQSDNNTNPENLGNPATSIPLTTRLQNSDKSQHATEESANIAHINLPAIIYKCSNCAFFGQLKQEVEAHIETTHSDNSSNVISIPTNPVAIQAFQAAMAAATLAAVSRASETSHTPSPLASPNFEQTKLSETALDNEDDLCPVTSKRGRLDRAKPEVTPEVSEQQDATVQGKQTSGVQCPLCQDYFTEKPALEKHLMTVHSVNKDGLTRLLLLVDTSMWPNEETPTANHPQLVAGEETSSSLTKAASDTIVAGSKPPLNGYELLLCQQCGNSFKHEQQLLQHAQKMQHYTLQNGEYLCLAFNSLRNPCTMRYPTLMAMFSHYNDTHMRLVISERHVYKYRCRQCSLAFKTQEKLATHTLYHTMRDATKCAMCQRNFRSTQAMQKHMEQAHSQTSSGNNMDCASPRTASPSGSENERPLPEANRTISASDNFEIESNRSVTPGQEICAPTQSPESTPSEPHKSPSLSNQQQQQMSTITALINQQQQNISSSELLNQLQMQHQQFQNIPALHSLQQMQQQFPQFAAAIAASGMSINPVEMLNLMQFHHLISLNFMNLAPPLIFGGNATAAAAVGSSVSSTVSTTLANTPNSSLSQPSGNIAPTTDLATPSSSTTALTITPTVAALPNVEVGAQALQQQQQQQQISPGASNSQLLNNQKRARTRITDDQLKILRAHFDINNSPSEESILEMSQKANLPMKVVKHWFRNTLFKERQRNKDSPYNFNNPPSTTLNLEEYERTGQTKVMPLTEQVQHPQLQILSRPSSAHSISNISEYSNQQQQQQQQQQQCDDKQREDIATYRSQTSSVASSTFPLDVQIKTEPGEDLTNLPSSIAKESSAATVMKTFLKQQQEKLRFSNLEQQEHDTMLMMTEQHLSSSVQQQQHTNVASFYNSYETKSESESSDMHSRPHTPNSNTTSNLYASMNDLLSQQLENMPLIQMGPPKKFQLNPNSNPCDRNMPVGVAASSSGSSAISATSSGGISVSSKLFEKHSPSAQYDNNSNSSNSSTTSSGKRANRTRFTDYQIKVLQEFFENNSYPKDSDLEYLSKLLLLSPRVIVVWFQNARQKQRKIYENQPNNSLYEPEEKKQNINYACKKCSLVFQRYYELIRHQKNHCFKEENNKKSAKAQIAAAQIAQNLSSEDSNSSLEINSAAAAALLAQHHQVGGATAASGLGKNTLTVGDFSPIPSNNNTPPRDQGNSSNSEHQQFVCDKCKLTFTHFEHLHEHQLMHLVNPNLPTEAHVTATAAAAVAAYGPFGSILQSLQQAAHLHQSAAVNSVAGQSAAKKRKYSETSSNADDVSSPGGVSLTGTDYNSHAKKYNFLYQYFLQNESNTELRQRFHSQESSELNIEFLADYYQQTELKKRNNYEFLFQYYIRNEQHTNVNFEVPDKKPSIEVLLQYYQLCESKKFFQLEASHQRIRDGPLMGGGIDISQHHTNASNSSPNSSRPAANDSDRSSSPGGSGINEGGLVNNIKREHSPLLTKGNTEHKTRSNGQHCNNNNTNDLLATSVDLNKHYFCQNTSLNERISTGGKPNKVEEQMDQLDGLQEVNNQSNSNHTTTAAPESPTHMPTDTTAGLTAYYRNLEGFLDATLVENHNQTLEYPAAESNNITNAPETSTRPLNSNTQPKEASTNTSNAPDSSHLKQANKRLRTTILPEQLNFLYECYQNESNPSRKMLEEISKKVSLKKRVVQVWFQNTRAKDKKSRNQQRQHFSYISDDNSNSSSVVANSNRKTNLAQSNLTAIAVACEESNDVRDCNLPVGQVPQVRPFTADHILKVKELLAQTTAAPVATLTQGDEEDNGLFNKFRINSDQIDNVQQHQLALMIMAFQTHNLPHAMMPLNALEDHSSAITTKSNESMVSNKQPHSSKGKKKLKGNVITKKKFRTKQSLTENPANDTETFFSYIANPLNTAQHYNATSAGMLAYNNEIEPFALSTNGPNDGNNNSHEGYGEMTKNSEQVIEVKRKNGGYKNKNNSDSSNDASIKTKSHTYNYNVNSDRSK